MKRKSLAAVRFYQPIKDIAAYWNKFKTATSIEVDGETKWIQQAVLFDDLSARNNVAVFLFSTVTPNRFLYITDKSKLLGYDAALYTAEDGMAFSMSNVHPDCLNAGYLMNEKAFNYVVENKVTPADKLIISIDSLYKIRDGTYIHFLQQTNLLEVNSLGQPMLTLCFISDISHIKKPNAFNMTIVSDKQIEIYRYNFDEKCLEPIKPFSDQENNVLKLLGQGLTTKEIASNLFISPHTVDTHRRNLINKTDCIDTTAVVTYARRPDCCKIIFVPAGKP